MEISSPQHSVSQSNHSESPSVRYSHSHGATFSTHTHTHTVQGENESTLNKRVQPLRHLNHRSAISNLVLLNSLICDYALLIFFFCEDTLHKHQ